MESHIVCHHLIVLSYPNGIECIFKPIQFGFAFQVFIFLDIKKYDAQNFSIFDLKGLIR
jgi:hypothetical protein